MKPSKTGESYDQITGLWESKEFDRLNGIEQHKKAMAFVKGRGNALDVGCGCTGRIIDLLLSSGFVPEGVDVSCEMIKLAEEKHPDIKFYQQDVCSWQMSRTYDFISAWDSLWHIPLSQQKKVITKLVSSLKKNGVLIFSFGGTDAEGDHSDNSMGLDMYYSTLGVSGFINLFIELGCICRHLEYDLLPELHAYLIVQKV